MMKITSFTRTIMVVSMATLISACSGGSSSTPASSPTPPAGSTPPTSIPSTPTVAAPIIDNEDLSAGLKGVDANSNGIRDDIDRLIALRYAQTPAMKKAAEQEARALQRTMEATTKVEARLAGNESGRASDCTFKIFPRGTPENTKFRERMSKEIEALTANTRERFVAYSKANALMGGMTFRQSEEPVCD